MHVCMNVYMYVCMYASIYACMHACMYVCMHVCTIVWKYFFGKQVDVIISKNQALQI